MRHVSYRMVIIGNEYRLVCRWWITHFCSVVVEYGRIRPYLPDVESRRHDLSLSDMILT